MEIVNGEITRDELMECIDDLFEFKEYNTVKYINNFNKKNGNNIACFDLDHTLIKPKSNRKLPKDSEDYVYLKNVHNKLLELFDNNFNIVIFTNQSGSKLNEVIEKLQSIFLELLPIQMSVYIATKDDYYRKPHTGMFELFISQNNINLDNVNNIFYCGDAAGRKFDFAFTDVAFAYNISLKYILNNKELNKFKFYTPEQFFLNDTTQSKIFCIDNSLNYVNDYYDEIIHNINIPNINLSSTQELVIMCGYPGSGKTNISKKLYKNKKLNDNVYLVISKDENKHRAFTMIKKGIMGNFSVVVDDTNVSIANREVYIELARKYNIPIKCIHVTTEINMCKHLNDMRVEISKGEIVKIPDVAYNVLISKFNKPTLKEGFNEIITIPFMLPSEKKMIPKEFYYIYNTLIS